MTHPTPLPAWCECRVWLGRCSACGRKHVSYIPSIAAADTRGNDNVIMTSKRRCGVVLTSLWRYHCVMCRWGVPGPVQTRLVQNMPKTQHFISADKVNLSRWCPPICGASWGRRGTWRIRQPEARQTLGQTHGETQTRSGVLTVSLSTIRR